MRIKNSHPCYTGKVTPAPGPTPQKLGNDYKERPVPNDFKNGRKPKKKRKTAGQIMDKSAGISGGFNRARGKSAVQSAADKIKKLITGK